MPAPLDPDLPYLTGTQLRAQVPDLAGWTDEQLDPYVTEFEQLAERYRGVAFTPRTATIEKQGQGDQLLLLDHAPIISVTDAAIDAVDVDLADVTVDKAIGSLSRLAGWRGTSVAISYVHGIPAPPAAILRACRLYVWREALSDANPDASNSYVRSNPDLGVVERQSTADFAAGRPTGWLDVDRLLNGLPDERVRVA